MDVYINLLLNLLFNSIPEETYFVLFVLVLMGTKKIKFDWRLATSIIVPAIVSNVCRYILNVNMSMRFPIFIATMSLTIILCYRKFKLTRAGLVMISTVIASVFDIILELMNYGFLMSCTTITENLLKEDIFIAFISSLPYRLIEVGTVILYIKMQKDIDQRIRVNLWQSILNNKKHRNLSIIVSIINIIWIVVSGKIFGVDNLLVAKDIGLLTSLIIVLGDVLVPVLLYVFVVYTIYTNRRTEIELKKLSKGFVITHVNVAKHYIKAGNYDRAISALEELKTIDLWRG